MSDHIYEEVVKGWPSALKELFPRERFHHAEETGSTNDDLRKLLRSADASGFTVVTADFQTAGRGRRGDRWEAPAGQNLLFSVALPLEGDRLHWSRLPHLSAYLVGQVVESVFTSDLRVQAKWPNDLLIDGKKLAGILVETIMHPAPQAIVGVGLNVNMKTEQFPESLYGQATSLYEILRCESSRWFLLGLILRGILENYPNGTTNFDPVLNWLEERSYLKGKNLQVKTASGIIEGVGRGMSSGGELLLERPDGGLEKILSAERILLC